MFRKTVLIRALTLAFSAAALSTAVVNPAMAQSNAAGSIYGKAAPGSTVVLKNTGTNQTRTVTADANGKFQVPALAIGTWTVTSGGKTATVEVIAGQGAEAAFAEAVQSVTIAGRRSRIDVSNATNGAVFTARELNKLPIARSVDAIIQLAPNTTKGDPTYAAGASFAGGGVSENAYYINGFPTTNPLTQLGASELPFGAIAQASVLVGGFGAEFGRSVGGVVNIVGKSGSNTWEGGAMASITPKSLRSSYVDRYYAVTKGPANTATDGTLRIRREDNERGSVQVGAYLGGPIIEDKLFMFASIEETKTQNDQVNLGRTSNALASSGFLKEKTIIDRYYTKFDFNVTDDHRLELTMMGDTPSVDSKYYSYNYTTREVGSILQSATHEKGNTLNNPNGGETQILRYTGNFDKLTVTSLYGQSKVKKIYEPQGYNPNLFAVTAAKGDQAPGLNYTSPQSFSGSIPLTGATDTIKFGRIDLEYALGSHTLRGGADDIKVESRDAGNVNAGGGTWIYAKSPDPTKPVDLQGVTLPAFAQLGGLAAQGYYVNRNIFTTASNSFSAQNAYYLEDKWAVTKNLLVTYGVRSESFSNANSAHEKFVEIKNQITPRISAAWDVNGDSSFKIFGSAGRYAIQIPNVVALRAANGSTNTSQYFAYTGTDANGIPTGLTQLTTPFSTNNEYGQPKNPKVVASQSIKPAYQDEITVGFEKSLSESLNFGTKFTHRKLKTTLDDVCDERPALKYAARNNIDISNYGGFGCAIFNTGLAGDFYIDFAGTGKNLTLAHLTAEDLGFVKAKRNYSALDFFAEHPLRNGWYGKINYTLAKSTGNTEGQTRSDGNAGQADVAQTATSDYPEYDLGADGNLPNDRRHQIKAFGFYQLTQQWTVGANLLIGSGRPNGCTGKNPHPNPGSPNYSSERYCGGVPNYLTNVLTPRGTTGRLPWEKNLDINIAYAPEAIKGLQFKADVFNVFNTQTVLRTAEQLNAGSGAISGTYGTPLANAAPRSVKFTAEYNHKF